MSNLGHANLTPADAISTKRPVTSIPLSVPAWHTEVPYGVIRMNQAQGPNLPVSGLSPRPSDFFPGSNSSRERGLLDRPRAGPVSQMGHSNLPMAGSLSMKKHPAVTCPVYQTGTLEAPHPQTRRIGSGQEDTVRDHRVIPMGPDIGR